MAAKLDKTDKRLDVLDRLFRRRKASLVEESTIADSNSSADTSFESQSDMTAQTFPSPSFMRPKSMRMLARDEVALASKPSRRTHSLPEPTNSDQRDSMVSSFEVGQSVQLELAPSRIPERASSLQVQNLGEFSLDELLNFNFPDSVSTSLNNPVWPSLLGPRSVSPKTESLWHNKPGYQHQEQVIVNHPRDPETPPLSARQENFPLSTPPGYTQQRPHASAYAHLTPGPSPQLSPRSKPPPTGDRSRSSSPRHRKSFDGSDNSFIKGVIASLRKSFSHSDISDLSSSHDPLTSKHPILEEPKVSDFMSLSDDDIADGRLSALSRLPPMSDPHPPPTSALPSYPVSPGSVSRCAPMAPPPLPKLTAPISLPSLPAAAAALEAAKIAERYRFDLVYIIKLCPSNVGCSRPRSHSRKPSSSSFSTVTNANTSLPSLASSKESSFSRGDHSTLDTTYNSQDSQSPPPVCVSPRSGMTGRLLAAYGLPSVMSPFRISAAVHRKALMTDGWLEYRSDGLAMDEFARGYSCSFHKGYSTEGRWRPVTSGDESSRNATTATTNTESSSAEDQTKRSKEGRPNRGIVFAAYRLPRTDGVSIHSDTAELVALHKDAEDLVDKLVGMRANQEQLLFSSGSLK